MFAAVTLAACSSGSDDVSEPTATPAAASGQTSTPDSVTGSASTPPTTAPPRSTSTTSTTTDPVPVVSPSIPVAAATTDVPESSVAPPDDGPPAVVVVDVGQFLGLGLFSPGADVVTRLSEYWGPPTADTGWQGQTTDWACEWGMEQRALHRGGLEIVLSTNESIGTDGIISNWRYVGPDGDHPEIVLVARDGLTIGSSRSEVLAAYPDVTDAGDFIDVNEGAGGFRFWVDGEQVSQFGVIDCAD